MSDIVIKAENLGKSYIIGHEQKEKYTALRDVITNKVRQIAGKTRQIFKGGQLISGAELEEFWALKNVSFEIKQGDRVGIIGRNGAGKSTLLKVLSRITEPTKGKVKIKGRVASLLEVGTGFHPELTGRENIFLNGAILGMNRHEIRKKFDEIVDFSGVEKFLDTPVKKYSSGMYVRLAFAVAAHLEPEILIVDEVLAVGDAEFQKKCLGKMEDVSTKEGRTVLFVSHNMGAIKQLCSTCILLEMGKIKMLGPIDKVIENYFMQNKEVATTGIIPKNFYRQYFTGEANFTHLYITDTNNNRIINLSFRQKFDIKIGFEIIKPLENVIIMITIGTYLGETIVFCAETENGYKQHDYKQGHFETKVQADIVLMPGNYYLSAAMAYSDTGNTIDFVQNVYRFNIANVGFEKGDNYPWQTVHGYVEAKTNWKLNKIN